MAISPGTRVRRYEVKSPLGAGGMGEVFLARDVELDRTVALKVLSDAPDVDGERNRRFILEARAAIALNHPNVAHVYDAGEENGVRFLAMEYVEGETLRARLSRERLTLAEALEIAVQVASALASAHARGIVHRDVKPENVMIRPDGYVKVLDFGLAKLTAHIGSADQPTAAIHTTPGLVMGTMQYMSPEQLRTDDVDARSDVFSLGVVLYEIVSGKRPFEASTPSGTIAAILTEEPAPLEKTLPLAIHTIIEKALAKKREDRYPTAKELAEALKAARDATNRIKSGDVPTQALTQLVTVRKPMPGKWIAIAAVVVVAIAVAVYYANHARVVRQARARLPELERLAEQRQYFATWDLAESLSKTLPDDPAIARALEKVGGTIDVSTEPAGAQVFLERVNPNGTTAARTFAGTTPLSKYALPLGDYIVRVEKQGFAPASRTISIAPIPVDNMSVPQRAPRMDWKLLPAKEAPGMVRVAGGKYTLSAWSRPTNYPAELDPFFIDQYEVTNRQFAEFISAGGYERQELWKHPFIDKGRTLPFEEAVARLKDTTGANAPRRWVNGAYPVGRDDYPVTDVTWYEAAAYAEFRGKTLPTMFQWDKAARDGVVTPFGMFMPWGVVPYGVDVSKRANFGGAPMPVSSIPAGMSAYGAFHMAGNVAEWCANRFGDGVVVAGGHYNSPAYLFGGYGSYPPFFSDPTIGFRCARVDGTPHGDQGGRLIDRNLEQVEIKRVSDAEFAEIARSYETPKTPLNAKVVERAVDAGWTREKIEFDGSNGQRPWGYLYLPRNAAPPFQVIHYIPAADVSRGARTADASVEVVLGQFIRAGRAVFIVVLRGYLGRPAPEVTRMRASDDEYAEFVALNVIELRRGLDYLVSRPDIDSQRIALYGPSAGAHFGVALSGVEPRYRSVILQGFGYDLGDAALMPRINRATFVPRIRAPKLMLHGRWDEGHPLETDAKPVYDLLPEPKELVVFDGGHIPPPEVVSRVLGKWLDDTMGKVKR